jgi:hypothetical protein
MMPNFILTDFLARSTDVPWGDTRLSKVLDALPPCGITGPWLAGGALRRTLRGMDADSDFDFFFHDADQLERFKGKLLDGVFKLHHETEHHVELRGKIGEEESIVQCIRFAYYDRSEDVIDSFDFTICQFAFDGRNLIVGEYALWDLGRKRLAINKITYPLSTMRRVLKYAKQGFNACPGCLTAILRATTDNPALMQTLNIQYID